MQYSMQYPTRIFLRWIQLTHRSHACSPEPHSHTAHDTASAVQVATHAAWTWAIGAADTIAAAGSVSPTPRSAVTPDPDD
jgi:hypothetical protein